MEPRDRKRTDRAIACLKPEVPPSDATTQIELSREDSPVLTPFSDGLLVVYLVDEGNFFTYVQYRDLDKDQVTEERLRAAALENLRALAAERLQVKPYGNIFATFLDGNFEASSILLDELWEKTFRTYVSGDYAAAIPARDVLAFGDAGSPQARLELRAVVDRLRGPADHAISDRLYVRSGGRWRPE